MHMKSTELKRMGRKCWYKYFSLFLHIFMTPFFKAADCSSQSSFHLCFQNDIKWSQEFFQNFIHKNKSMALNMQLLWRHMWDPVVVCAENDLCDNHGVHMELKCLKHSLALNSPPKAMSVPMSVWVYTCLVLSAPLLFLFYHYSYLCLWVCF